MSFSYSIASLIALVLQRSCCFELNCSYGYYQSWPIKNFYTCTAVNLFVTDDGTKVTSVTKGHLVGKTNGDVEVLDITGQTSHFLPEDIQKFFPNLKGLHVSGSKFRVIRRKDLAPFQKLLFIYVPYNEIRYVDGDLFASNLGVEYISFSENRLMTHVGYNLLEPMKNLKEVHFSNCNCINKHVLSPPLVDQMSLALAISCPPTMEMLESQTLDGELFSSKLNEAVLKATKPIEIEIKNLKMIIDELTSSSVELMKLVRETQPPKCECA